GGPTASEPINPSHLPWMVYTYDPDGFARERPEPRNPNVMGYHFPPSTQMSITLISFTYIPLSKSMRSWYNWLGISSWR
ncbi:hypothetical protein SO802_012372, partial [Lithocarpus litseifolius]